MNKKNVSVIAGLLVGATLAGTSLLAVNTTTLNNVISEGIKIVIDGQKLVPTDANGNTVEPFVYNGTTYLPVRAVANAFGKAVYWDGPEFTVYLGDMDGKLEYPTVELRDLTSIADDHSITTQPEDNYGNRYTYALRCNGIHGHYPTTYEYLTGMKYSKLKGTLYVTSTNRDVSSKFEIIADGRRIYTSPTLNKTSAPIPLEIDITGYNDIRLEFSGDWCTTLCFADAGFYQ